MAAARHMASSKKTAAKEAAVERVKTQAAAEGREPTKAELKEAEKEKPEGYIVQTHGAILPVSAVRNQGEKNEEKVDDHTPLQVGDYVELPPSVAAQHQEAGVGLSLADPPNEAD